EPARFASMPASGVLKNSCLRSTEVSCAFFNAFAASDSPAARPASDAGAFSSFFIWTGAAAAPLGGAAEVAGLEAPRAKGAPAAPTGPAGGAGGAASFRISLRSFSSPACGVIAADVCGFALVRGADCRLLVDDFKGSALSAGTIGASRDSAVGARSPDRAVVREAAGKPPTNRGSG